MSVAAFISALFYQDMHTDIRYWMRNNSGSLDFNFVKPKPVTKNWVSWLSSVCLWEIMPSPLFQLVQMFCAGPESDPVRTLQKSFGWDYKPRSPCVYACKNITYTRQRSCSPCQSSVHHGNTKTAQHALKVSEPSQCLSGLWKHQNSPACTKSVRAFTVFKQIIETPKQPSMHWKCQSLHSVSVDYGNTKTSQHALKVSAFTVFKRIMETPKQPSRH